jgi:hypothetical protein
MANEVIQKTSECHSAECRHNTGKQIDQPARVNLVEALFQQFSETERKASGRQEEKTPFAIAGKKFHPKSSSVCEKINIAEERHKVLLSTVSCRDLSEGIFEAYHTKLNF